MLLFRPVNQAELDLIIAAKWTVLNEAYANQISRDWNVPSPATYPDSPITSAELPQ